MSRCKSPYGDYSRRRVAEWEEKMMAASVAGDTKAFERAEQELANYRLMLADDVEKCGCGGNCPALSDDHSSDTPCR